MFFPNGSSFENNPPRDYKNLPPLSFPQSADHRETNESISSLSQQPYGSWDSPRSFPQPTSSLQPSGFSPEQPNVFSYLSSPPGLKTTPYYGKNAYGVPFSLSHKQLSSFNHHIIITAIKLLSSAPTITFPQILRHIEPQYILSTPQTTIRCIRDALAASDRFLFGVNGTVALRSTAQGDSFRPLSSTTFNTFSNSDRYRLPESTFAERRPEFARGAMADDDMGAWMSLPSVSAADSNGPESFLSSSIFASVPSMGAQAEAAAGADAGAVSPNPSDADEAATERDGAFVRYGRSQCAAGAPACEMSGFELLDQFFDISRVFEVDFQLKCESEVLSARSESANDIVSLIRQASGKEEVDSFLDSLDEPEHEPPSPSGAGALRGPTAVEFDKLFISNYIWTLFMSREFEQSELIARIGLFLKKQNIHISNLKAALARDPRFRIADEGKQGKDVVSLSRNGWRVSVPLKHARRPAEAALVSLLDGICRGALAAARLLRRQLAADPYRMPRGWAIELSPPLAPRPLSLSAFMHMARRVAFVELQADDVSQFKFVQSSGGAWRR
eukprot:gnl/Chilomastix_cuspidata/4230.p1 GENE.gnl/Chilomastix_cuspidata/4230~~gnl/Chilomastix_cuspidata/4230.p1  ORF type:complete len:559 (+),score=172.92 gnl/Chilomastix_cuspidata/4230:48-1724(+)